MLPLPAALQIRIILTMMPTQYGYNPESLHDLHGNGRSGARLDDPGAEKPGVLAQASAPVALDERGRVPDRHAVVQHHGVHAQPRVLDRSDAAGHDDQRGI